MPLLATACMGAYGKQAAMDLERYNSADNWLAKILPTKYLLVRKLPAVAFQQHGSRLDEAKASYIAVAFTPKKNTKLFKLHALIYYLHLDFTILGTTLSAVSCLGLSTF